MPGVPTNRLKGAPAIVASRRDLGGRVLLLPSKSHSRGRSSPSL